MASKKDFPLTLTIKAVDEATAPLRRLSTSITKLSKLSGLSGVGASLKNVGNDAMALGTKFAAMAGVAGYAIYSLVRRTVDAGDKLGEMAQRTGTSVDYFASLGHAMAQADVDTESFNGAMDQFNKRLGDARNGTGALAGHLKKSSPALLKQMKAAKSNEEAMSLLTDAFSKIEDPARRASLAAAAFGRSGLQMGEALHQGSAEIQKQQQEYMRLRGSQEDFAKQSGILDNAIRKTEEAFGGLVSAAGGKLFPAFTKLAEAVTDFIVKNRDGIAAWAEKTATAITNWVEGGGIDRLVAGFKDFSEKIEWVIEKLGGFRNAAMLAVAVMAGPLMLSTLGLIGNIFKLGLALDANTLKLIPWAGTWLKYLWTMRGALLTSIMMPAKAALGSMGGLAASFGSAALAAAPFIIAAGALAAAGYALYKGWQPIKELFADGNFFAAVKDMVSSPLASLGNAKDWWSNEIFGGSEQARPNLGADPALASSAAGASGLGHITVDITGAPKGTQVSSEAEGGMSIETNTSLGPIMSGG